MRQIKLSFEKKMQQVLAQQPLIIGVGNTLRGDDGAAILLVEKLKESGFMEALAVHSTPENYLGKIAGHTGHARLWIDIIHWKATPGSFRFFRDQEIENYAISTHNYSISVLVRFLSDMKNVPDYFIGIEPESIEMGESISQPVQNAIDEISRLILSITKK